MEKEQIIKTILDVSNGMGLSVETKVKTEKWKADVVIDYGKYKVAFTVNKTSQKAKEYYQAMKERYSKTVRDSYMSFGCAFCDALFGNFYLRYHDIGDEDFEEPTAFFV